MKVIVPLFLSLVVVANAQVSGDAFIIAGQSNASGRGTRLQIYAGATPAYLFGNNYILGPMLDPTDSSLGQIDMTSSDGQAPRGSVWPIVATRMANDTGRTSIFVPCSRGATTILQWQPKANHFNRQTLYGSMCYRARLVGNTKAVFWWHGGTDAIAGMTQATYHAYLAKLAAAIAADLGVPLMVAKNERWPEVPLANEIAVNKAIVQAWRDVPNVVAGPDLSDMVGDGGGPHLFTDAKLAEAGRRWWAAIKIALY